VLLTQTLLSFKLKFCHDRRLRKKHVLHSSFACVSRVVYITERGEKCTFEFAESSGKLGLKMTNTKHTDERKMVWLSYFVPGYVNDTVVR